LGDFDFQFPIEELKAVKDVVKCILDVVDNLNIYNVVCTIQRKNHISTVDSSFASMSELLISTATVKDCVDVKIFEKTHDGKIVRQGSFVVTKTRDSVNFACVWE
jgi:hypothetical protein